MSGKNKVNVCALISLLMIIVGIVYVVVCTINGLLMNLPVRLIFAIWVAIYVVLTNFIEPVATSKFRKKKKKQVEYYYKYAFLDTFGVAGLLWFAIMAGIFDDYTHYAGIAVFAATFVPKRVFFKKYNMRSSYYDRYDEDDIELEDNLSLPDAEEGEEDFDIDINI